MASFAGFAPVSNPAIAVAVVIDTPTAGGEVSHYGGATSAPVFADVAQQVLEYLGVPHDQPLKTTKDLQVAGKANDLDDGPGDGTADVSAMLADVESLPTDDPLRTPVQTAAPAPVTHVAEAKPQGVMKLLPDKVLRAFHAGGGSNSILNDGDIAKADPPRIAPTTQRNDNGNIVVDAGERVAVPSFAGAGLRAVVVQAAAVGLRVQPMGSGLAHEQSPAAGTMVPSGTEVVVRFLR